VTDSIPAAAATCPGCGAELAAGDRFCRSCGRAVAPPTVQPSTVAPPITPAEPSSDWTKPVGGPQAEPSGDWTKPVGGPQAEPSGDWTKPVGGAQAEPSGDWTKPVGGPQAAPSSDWTKPVGGPRRSGSGCGARLADGLRAVGRGTVGCLVLLIGLGILGAVLSSLGDAGSTERPSSFAPESTPAAEPTERPIEPETEPPPPLEMELADAIAAGLVAMTAEGMNLQELALGLDSLADEALQVQVPPGTLFKPRASETQSMVVITETSIYLAPGEHVDFVLDVACAAMNKGTPGSSDRFTLATKPASSDLRKLVGSPGFADAGFRVQQFAIWTITNNPTRSGYVGLGTFGIGSGPSSAELREIKALFKAAGIDVTKYRALS
jgi:hypothetical protein